MDKKEWSEQAQHVARDFGNRAAAGASKGISSLKKKQAEKRQARLDEKAELMRIALENRRQAAKKLLIAGGVLLLMILVFGAIGAAVSHSKAQPTVPKVGAVQKALSATTVLPTTTSTPATDPTTTVTPTTEAPPTTAAPPPPVTTAQAGCTTSPSGNCYQRGQLCPSTYRGQTVNGEYGPITCTPVGSYGRWE